MSSKRGCVGSITTTETRGGHVIVLPTSVQDGRVVNNQLSVSFELLKGFVLSFSQVLGRRLGTEKKKWIRCDGP